MNGRALPDRRSVDVAPDVLVRFLAEGVRPWGTVPARLSSAVTATLWTLLVLNLALAAVLVALRAGEAPCAGLVCTVATLGDHPLLVFVLAISCAAALTVAAPATRGLSRANGPQLAVVVPAGLCGVFALAGVAAVLVGAALCLAVGLGLLFVIVDRL